MSPKEQIQRAEKLLTPETWVGHSGEQVTGEQAARHLEAALEQLVERAGWSVRTGDTLWRAMLAVADSPDGDADTRAVAETCMRLIVRARTGALTVYLMQWEERKGRTFDEVRDLVEAAAQLARKHGPAGGAR